MTIDIIEHNSLPPLLMLIDEIQTDADAPWGVTRIKRDYLRPMTNEAFLLAIQSVLQEATAARIFFTSPQRIYIAWNGSQKRIYKLLRSFIGSVLTQPGSVIEFSSFVSYIDPRTQKDTLKEMLRDENPKSGREAADSLVRKAHLGDDAFGFDDDDDNDEEAEHDAHPQLLASTAAQRDRFAETGNQRSFRKQLQILVVEDQVFSQKLLCEIIRSSRTSGHDAPAIDAVPGIQEAWKIYLKKAHDIVFVDLGLADGSGHALARAIKELDPSSQVIIVTANNFEEELGVARQNNVDGFIAKPYNKKQILDCIEKYVNGMKSRNKGTLRGTASQF